MFYCEPACLNVYQQNLYDLGHGIDQAFVFERIQRFSNIKSF